MKIYMSSIEGEKGDLDERNNSEKQQEKSFEERIREMPARNINSTERFAIQTQLMELESNRRPTTSVVSIPKSRLTQPVDEKAIMRKTIGAMVKYLKL